MADIIDDPTDIVGFALEQKRRREEAARRELAAQKRSESLLDEKFAEATDPHRELITPPAARESLLKRMLSNPQSSRDVSPDRLAPPERSAELDGASLFDPLTGRLQQQETQGIQDAASPIANTESPPSLTMAPAPTTDDSPQGRRWSSFTTDDTTEPVVNDPRRMTSRERRGFAANPASLADADLTSGIRGASDLHAQLHDMTQDNSDLTDGLPLDEYLKRQQRAKQEAQFQRQMKSDEARAETNSSLQRRSGQSTQNAAQRSLMKSLLGDKYAGLNRADDNPQAGADVAMREFEDRQKYANNRLGGIRQAERGGVKDTAATASWQRRQTDQARGAGGGDSVVDGESTPDEIAARQKRLDARYKMASDSAQTLSPGTSRTMDASGRYALQGTPMDPERKAANDRHIKLASDKSLANRLLGKQGHNDALEGIDPPEDATPEYLRAYETGRRQRQNEVGLQARQRYDIAMANSPKFSWMNGDRNAAGRGAQAQDVARINNADNSANVMLKLAALKEVAELKAAAAQKKGDQAAEAAARATAVTMQEEIDALKKAGQPPAAQVPERRKLNDALLGAARAKPRTAASSSVANSDDAEPADQSVAALEEEKRAILRRGRAGARGSVIFASPEDQKRIAAIDAYLKAQSAL